MNEAGPALRRLFSDEWIALATGVVGIALHLWWFCGSDHPGDVLTGLGGFLAALGIYVAAQPYIRKGLIETAREQVGLDDGNDPKAQGGDKEEDVEREGVRHVLKERVVGVLLIALGSTLNGYGVALARLLSSRGP